jgi:hypothetical protein
VDIESRFLLLPTVQNCTVQERRGPRATFHETAKIANPKSLRVNLIVFHILTLFYGLIREDRIEKDFSPPVTRYPAFSILGLIYA